LPAARILNPKRRRSDAANLGAAGRVGVCLTGTASYDGERGLPALVERAVELARSMRFPYSCHPAQGRLLALLAQGRPGGLIGETGTGCGVGLAWMLSAADPTTRLVSIERDRARAEAARELFAPYRQVQVLTGDWPALLEHGPFDLLVLDGGGSGKTAGDTPVAPREALRGGGSLVIDDWTPWDRWPPRAAGEVDGVQGSRQVLDQARLHWLQHPDLLASEARMAPTLSTIIAMRR
jgi:predicted O-methyltransferase YrrM